MILEQKFQKRSKTKITSTGKAPSGTQDSTKLRHTVAGKEKIELYPSIVSGSWT
jgi:hypothetical protein